MIDLSITKTGEPPEQKTGKNKMTTSNKTIVYFHTGRGGHFNNQGHVTFCGEKTIGEVLAIADNSSQWSFLQNRENGRFCKPYYSDCNGNFLISKEDVDSGVGSIDWDGDYDTDNCIYLSDCGEKELQLIAESNEWNKESLIQEYVDNHTDLNADWKKFDGRYSELIEDWFNFPTTNIEDFYEEN